MYGGVTHDCASILDSNEVRKLICSMVTTIYDIRNGDKHKQ